MRTFTTVCLPAYLSPLISHGSRLERFTMLLRSRSLTLLALGVLSLFLSACGSKESGGAAAGQGPVEVGVVTITTADAPLTAELPGRTTAYRRAEVRPQVTGIIQKRLFEEGAEIKAGTQLYQIDEA